MTHNFQDYRYVLTSKTIEKYDFQLQLTPAKDPRNNMCFKVLYHDCVNI